MAKCVAALADRSVHTLDWESTAPNTVVVLVVLGPLEISLHGTGYTNFGCDRIGRYTELRSENRKAKTFGALVDKEHVSTRIEGDRASRDTSSIRTPWPAGCGEQTERFVSELEE